MQLTASNPQFAYAPVMTPMFASGGMADTAEVLQSQGRGNDSMLVHMTPGEVKGLQALAMQHGGSLTINPSTGLPEAGFLEKILPTVLGVGLSFVPGVGPLMAAGLVGGFETIRTGDLGKGLMAGLGAYGGANIGTALTSMGSQAAASAALPAAGSTATGVAPVGESLLAQSISAPQMSTVPGMGSSLLQSTGSAPMSQAAVSALQDQATQNFAQQGMFNQLGQGVKAAAADPSAFGSTLYGQMGKYGTMAAATPMAMALSESMAPKPMELQKPEESNYEGPYYPYEREVRFRDPEDRSTSEFAYFTPSNPVPGYVPYRAASGGLMGLAEGGEARGPVRMPGKDYQAGTSPEFDYGFRPVEIQGKPFNAPPEPAYKNFDGFVRSVFNDLFGKKEINPNYTDLSKYRYDPMTQQMVRYAVGGPVAMAKGGVDLDDGAFVVDARTVSEIGNGSSNAGLERLMKMGAKPIQGPGDGTSDSIRANIGGVQEARVARDEAVFPAEAVKKIGRGNPKAGAKKLYSLMDKAHAARKKAKRGQDTGLAALMA